MAHRVDEAAGCLEAAELLDLDRRMADDFQQLLVRPDIGLERRDVEIADQDHRLVAGAVVLNQPVDLIEEAQLMANFGLSSGSGMSPPAGT